MSQVRVRSAETSLTPRHAGTVWRRLAIAATVAVAVTSATLAYRFEHRAPATQPAHLVASVKPHPAALATKSFVETYSSHNATIVEVPNDGSDAKVVMIFDDTLPADL
jgi:anti-sigma-K factor RskA